MGNQEVISIRRMEPGDAVYVREMCRKLVDHVRSCGQDAEFYWDDERLKADMFGRHPWLWGYVAVMGDQVVGYTIASLGYELDRWRRELEVLDLYVEPVARGSGAARKLLAANATLGRELGCDQVCGLVFKDNENMLRIFRRLGAELQDYHVLYRVKNDVVLGSQAL